MGRDQEAAWGKISRINRQWRLCFEWPDAQPGPGSVEIVDHH